MRPFYMYALIIVLLCALPGAAETSSPVYRVVLDSDAKNEIDDQYAITYALKHPGLEVLGVNAAHFARPDSMDASYKEIKKIVQLMDLAGQVSVLQGAEHALVDRTTPQPSEAARFIVEQARASTETLYIVAFGALTNVAAAYLLAPDIAARVELYWLGGSFWPEGGREFNAENDPLALQVVMESPLPVHLIPAHGVGGLLGLTYIEAERRLRHTDPVGDFLVQRFKEIGDASRAIWDLSAPALLLHPEWGTQIRAPAPQVTDDLRYLPNPEGKTITVFVQLDADKIFEDFFSRFPVPTESEPLDIVGASCVKDGTHVLVEFSNYPEKTSAEDVRNYSIPGIEVRDAHLSANGMKLLLMTSPHQPGVGYELTVRNVRDYTQNPQALPTSSVQYTYFPSFDTGLSCSFFQFDRPLFDFPDVSTREPDTVQDFPGISFSYTVGKLRGTQFLENVFMRCTGYVEVRDEGPYTYWVESTGGIRLRLDDNLLYEKKPQSPTLALSAKVELPKGIHRLTLDYLPNHRLHMLLLYWFLPHTSPKPVPETHLFHDVKAGAP